MDDSTFEHYIRLYRKNVCMTALFYTKNPGDADDITQEVFFRLYTYSGSFVSDEHVKAWLLRCAINMSKNLLRSHWYRFSRPLDEADEKVHCDIHDEDGLLQYIAKLGRNNRIVLYMFYYEGYSVNEIADILKISKTTVTSRLSRGRQQLKKILTERNDTENGLQRNI